MKQTAAAGGSETHRNYIWIQSGQRTQRKCLIRKTLWSHSPLTISCFLSQLSSLIGLVVHWNFSGTVRDNSDVKSHRFFFSSQFGIFLKKKSYFHCLLHKPLPVSPVRSECGSRNQGRTCSLHHFRKLMMTGHSHHIRDQQQFSRCGSTVLILNTSRTPNAVRPSNLPWVDQHPPGDAAATISRRCCCQLLPDVSTF